MFIYTIRDIFGAVVLCLLLGGGLLYTLIVATISLADKAVQRYRGTNKEEEEGGNGETKELGM